MQVDSFREIMMQAKNACSDMQCKECPFATGVYMNIQQDYEYFCNLRKRPEAWDLSSEKPILVKEGSPVTEKDKKPKKSTVRKRKKN